MTLADRARTIGQEINGTAGAFLGPELNAGIAEFVGWPFVVSPGRVEDRIGKMTAHFACVVHTAANGSPTSDVIPADNAAVVIDVIENMGIDEFRAAYERIAEVKRLQKSPAPNLNKTAVATLTLTLIFAQRSTVSLEVLAEELQRLSETRPGEEWPDMIAVSGVGVISYACQFPGHSKLGDIFPPAEKGLKALPAMAVRKMQRVGLKLAGSSFGLEQRLEDTPAFGRHHRQFQNRCHKRCFGLPAFGPGSRAAASSSTASAFFSLGE